MTPEEYLKLSEVTEKKFDDGQFLIKEQLELLHHAMGLVTEAGEFMDQMKKHLIYGKQIDKTNLKEEIGDILWYLAGACRCLGTTLEEEMDRNIDKLRHRYGDKFDAYKALNRDLEGERKLLEAQPKEQEYFNLPDSLQGRETPIGKNRDVWAREVRDRIEGDFISVSSRFHKILNILKEEIVTNTFFNEYHKAIDFIDYLVKEKINPVYDADSFVKVKYDYEKGGMLTATFYDAATGLELGEMKIA